MRGYLGKYREIVLAVACFLVFDFAVLLLNFYISFQISESAVAINLAGRQRMLSQRMTKELLEVQDDRAQGRDIAPAVARLQKSVELFDRTLAGFHDGGQVPGGDGKPVQLAPVASASGRAILTEADALWQPFRRMVPQSAAGLPMFDLDRATAYAREKNTALLALMNKLTTDLERSAGARANTLRLVQTAGILLALLNFAFILFKFIRRLQANDKRIEAAQAETAEILGTVKEGLFLLDHDFRIGSQFSASLAPMLGTAIAPGRDFRSVLQGMLPTASVKTAVEYIGLLLGERVKEALVQDLNPLVAVPVSISDADGLTQRRYLTLQFNRVLVEGRISHLLVTVFDVTAQVELEQALAETRARAKAEVEVMLDLLKVNPATLRHFLDRGERSLLEINDLLRHASNDGRDYRRSLALMFRLVHMLKGEAAALGLGMFEELAQQFEELLSGLRNRGAVTGADLLALPLPLDEFLQRIASVRELGQRLAAYQSAFPASGSDATLLTRMQELAQRIARDHGKQVQVEADLDLLQTLPAEQRDHLQDIALQLLRNAVVHGIEPLPARAERRKPSRGTIAMSLRQVDNEYEFLLRDDGQGLVPARIAEALVSRGLYTREQTAELGERALIMKIFEPGFSTAEPGGRDAGQGVGLDVVKEKLQALGARLQISSKADQYTQFRIRFSF